MVYNRPEDVIEVINSKIPDLHLAELIMVNDYIDGLRGAREFLRRG